MLLPGSTFPHAVVAGADDKAKVHPTNQWWARGLTLLVEALSAPPEWYKWVCCVGVVVGRGRPSSSLDLPSVVHGAMRCWLESVVFYYNAGDGERRRSRQLIPKHRTR